MGQLPAAGHRPDRPARIRRCRGRAPARFEVRALKRERGRDIWLCGGGEPAGAPLPEIDQLILKSYPVVAGAGVALFDGGFDPTLFRAADRDVFPNGVSVTWHTARR